MNKEPEDTDLLGGACLHCSRWPWLQGEACRKYLMVTSWPVLKLLREEEMQEGDLEDAGGKKVCQRKNAPSVLSLLLQCCPLVIHKNPLCAFKPVRLMNMKYTLSFTCCTLVCFLFYLWFLWIMLNILFNLWYSALWINSTASLAVRLIKIIWSVSEARILQQGNSTLNWYGWRYLSNCQQIS